MPERFPLLNITFKTFPSLLKLLFRIDKKWPWINCFHNCPSLRTGVLQKFNSNKVHSIQNYLKKESFKKNLELLWFNIGLRPMPLSLLSLQEKQKGNQTNLLWIGKNYIRIHWRLLKILKRVWSNAFCYVKVYTFWFFANTPYIEMKYKRSKKFLQTKSTFPELQLITVLLLTCKHSNCPGLAGKVPVFVLLSRCPGLNQLS